MIYEFKNGQIWKTWSSPLSLYNSFKKEVSDKVAFLHAVKYESFLKIDVTIFDEDGQTFVKFKNSKFAVSLRYLQKS